jgi:CelD/BcsL family acetyltransferase involved in cellulose biosynthesis
MNPIENYKDVQLTVRLVSSVQEFAELKELWNSLAVASSSTIYQTFEWSFCWWQSYSTKQQYDLHILLFYNDKQLVGLASLFIYKNKIFNRTFYKSLKFLGTGTAFGASFGLFADNGPSDYLDILLLPGFESNVAKSFWEYLNNQHNLYDEIEFVNLREDSNFINYFVPAINKSQFKYRRYKAECCPYIKRPNSIADYLQALPASVRRRMVQTYKAAEEGKLYKIAKHESTEDIQKAYDELVQLHQERWNRIGYLGFFFDKRYSKFFENVFRSFLSNGWLWFKSAYSDNKCVASRLAFKYNGRYYDYLSAFDDLAPAAKRRPGLALLIDMLRDAISDNSLCLDLLRGDEQYKFELTASQNCNWNFVLTSSSGKNRIKYIIQKILIFIKLIGFLRGRELNLLKVQRISNGYFSSLYYYAKFRFPHFIKKIKEIMLNKIKTITNI